MRAAGDAKLPVNLVLVAEGEEEIGSPHIGQIVHRPEVEAALLRKCDGVFMPSASQDLDGFVTVSLGAKGVVELELVASGETWGRGPSKDIHSSLKAMVDSPAWHLVKALDTAGFRGRQHDPDRGLSPAAADQRGREGDGRGGLAAPQRSEGQDPIRQCSTGSTTCRGSRRTSGLVSQPTVNIEGLVGGYTGPGGENRPSPPRRRQARPARWCPT